MSDDIKIHVIMTLIAILVVGITVGIILSSRVDACAFNDWEHYRGRMCVDSEGYVRLPNGGHHE